MNINFKESIKFKKKQNNYKHQTKINYKMI